METFITKYIIYSPGLNVYVADVIHHLENNVTSDINLAYQWTKCQLAIDTADMYGRDFRNPFYVYEVKNTISLGNEVG